MVWDAYQLLPEILAVIALIGMCGLCQVACWCPIAQRFQQGQRGAIQNASNKKENVVLKIQVLPQKQKIVMMPNGSLKYGQMCKSDTSLANSTPLLEGIPVYLAGYDSDGEIDMYGSNNSTCSTIEESII